MSTCDEKYGIDGFLKLINDVEYSLFTGDGNIDHECFEKLTSCDSEQYETIIGKRTTNWII